MPGNKITKHHLPYLSLINWGKQITMSETLTISDAQEIIQDNLDYTLFSWSKQKGLNPIAVKHAEGVYLYDYDGNRYIDFSSGLMNVNIGHGDQRITNAVVRQMQEISYVTPSCVTKVRGELGKKLAEICPGDLNKAFFTFALFLALCGTGTCFKFSTRLSTFVPSSWSIT